MSPVRWAAVPVESVIADFQTHSAKDFKFLHKASIIYIELSLLFLVLRLLPTFKSEKNSSFFYLPKWKFIILSNITEKKIENLKNRRHYLTKFVFQ